MSKDILKVYEWVVTLADDNGPAVIVGVYAASEETVLEMAKEHYPNMTVTNIERGEFEWAN